MLSRITATDWFITDNIAGMTIENFEEAVEFLYKTVPKTKAKSFGGGRAFEQSVAWFKQLGGIQDDRPTIHIAATSGKGTTAHMTEAILLSHGLTTATLTSPHVYSLTERTRINGQELTQQEFVETLNELLTQYRSFKPKGRRPTYFEMNMAIGFLAAKKNQVDVSIVETGFGGLLDTSNTITRPDKICVIGQIGYDHTSILGHSLEQITEQKAGIIQPGQTVIALKQLPVVNQVIEKVRDREGC